MKSVPVIIWAMLALVFLLALTWLVMPFIVKAKDAQQARLCEERWGQSKLRWKYLNHICYVEIEDGFIPDWHYKSGRIK